MTARERSDKYRSQLAGRVCDCGKPAVRYTNSGWQCDRCLRKRCSAVRIRLLLQPR